MAQTSSFDFNKFRRLYPPGERVVIKFVVPPDPRDARIAELEQALATVQAELEAARNGHV